MTHVILSQTEGLGIAERSETDKSGDTTIHLEATELRLSLDLDENESDIPGKPVILATDPSEPHITLTAAKEASTTWTRPRNDHEGNTNQSPSYYSPIPIDERM
jgi:hypothetical protein